MNEQHGPTQSEKITGHSTGHQTTVQSVKSGERSASVAELAYFMLEYWLCAQLRLNIMLLDEEEQLMLGAEYQVCGFYVCRSSNTSCKLIHCQTI